jgi:hypothetical protein
MGNKRTRNKDLPKGIYHYHKEGFFGARVSYWNNRKNKITQLTMGPFPTKELAIECYNIVVKLIGKEPRTKMRVHQTDVWFTIRSFRVLNGLSIYTKNKH